MRGNCGRGPLVAPGRLLSGGLERPGTGRDRARAVAEPEPSAWPAGRRVMGAADVAAQSALAGLFVGRYEELSEFHAALRRAVASRPE